MKKKAAFFLLVILVLAAVLRFWGLSSRGLFSHDEGYYFLGAKTIAAGVEYAKLKVFNAENLPSISDFLRQKGGDYPVGSKYGFYILSTLSMVFFGLKDYAVLYTSAFFGALSVWLVYLIVKGVFDRNTALLSAFLLAVSPYHIIYSRSAYANASAAFFILCGIYFYLKSVDSEKTVFMVFSGLCLGYAVTCHPSQLWVAAIFLIDLLFFRKIKRLIVLASSFMVPVLIFQIFSLFIISAARAAAWKDPGQINVLIQPYFSQFFIQAKSAGGARFNFSEALFYVRLLLKSEGALILLFYVLGLSGAALMFIKKQLSYKKALVTFLGLFLIVLWTLYNNRSARTLLPVLPFILITVAAGLSKINRYLAIFIIASLLWINSGAIASCIKTRSAYPQAVAFIKQSGSPRHFTDTTTLSASYMPDNYKSVYVPEQVSIDKAREMVKRHGFRYLILSYSRYSVNNSELIDFTNKSKIKPVLKIKSKPFFLLLSDDTDPDSFRLTQDIDSVDVYDTWELLKI